MKNKTWPNNYRLEPCPIRAGCLCDPTTLDKPSHLLAMEHWWSVAAPLHYCINLQSRNDRLQEAAAQFHSVGLCRLVQYFRPDKPDDAFCAQHGIRSKGLYGCWTSHQLCCRLAVKQKVPRCAIWEDDVVFRLGLLTTTHLSSVVHDLTDHLPDDWDVFKWGQLSMSGTPVSTCRDSSHWYDMGRVYRADSTTTHAMVWSQKGMQRMANSDFLMICGGGGRKEQHVDQWMRNNGMQMYSCHPQIAYQSESKSSNIQKPATATTCADAFWSWKETALWRLNRQHSDNWDRVVYAVVPFLWIWCLAFAALIVLSSVIVALGSILFSSSRETTESMKRYETLGEGYI